MLFFQVAYKVQECGAVMDTLSTEESQEFWIQLKFSACMQQVRLPALIAYFACLAVRQDSVPVSISLPSDAMS